MNNSPDEDEIYINPDTDKAIIEEEFEGVTYSLPEIINRDYREEYRFDLNAHWCIAKDVSDRSMGLRANENPYMIIFTITKNFTLTWEVYLEYYERKFTAHFEDLLRVTHHIYFIGVTEENSEKFEEFWIDLSCNFYNNDNKINSESNFYKSNNNINLRSMIFIPHRPRATISHVFTKETLKIIQNSMRYFEDSEIKITYTFERYDFKDIDTFNMLLYRIYSNNIKLFKWRLHLTSNFKVLFKGIRDSTFNLVQWNVFDKNERESIVALEWLVTWLKINSFNPNKILIKQHGKFKNVKMWDFLALWGDKVDLYEINLMSFRDNLNPLNQNDDILSQIKILGYNLSISVPQTSQPITQDMINGFIHAYIKQITPIISRSNSSSEIARIVFEDSVVPPPLSTEEIKDWSWEIDNADLSCWETSFILNVCWLMGKMSIKNSKLSLIRHRTMFLFFDYEFSNMKKLHIENISFAVMHKKDLIALKEFSNEITILQAYNKNINSYCLCYILKMCKLLNSLEEISIERMDSSFAENLFEQIKKELTVSNAQKEIRIIYRDPETQEEVEITQEYLDKKFESRVEFANSKSFEEVSYEHLLFQMLLCFKNLVQQELFYILVSF